MKIKARAWNKINNEMLYGTAGKDSGLVFVKPEDMYEDEREEIGFRDKDIEIMLWTGFVDKNNKEIYSGDIVIWSETEKKVINWDFDLLSKLKLRHDKVEVIGDTYQNSELIK